MSNIDDLDDDELIEALKNADNNMTDAIEAQHLAIKAELNAIHSVLMDTAKLEAMTVDEHRAAVLNAVSVMTNFTRRIREATLMAMRDSAVTVLQ